MFGQKSLDDALPAVLPASGFDDMAHDFQRPQSDQLVPLPVGPAAPAMLATPQGYNAPTFRPAPSPGLPPPGPLRPGSLSTYAVPYGAPLVPQYGQQLPGVPFGYEAMMQPYGPHVGPLGTEPPPAPPPAAPEQKSTVSAYLPWIIALAALGAAGGMAYLLIARSKSKPRSVRSEP